MKKILVIAESALLRTVLKVVLEEEGYSVDLACSSPPLPQCHSEDLSLVIVDRQDGDEADDVVNAMRTRGAKTITLSDDGVHPSISASHTFLSKPLDLIVLRQHVRAILDYGG